MLPITALIIWRNSNNIKDPMFITKFGALTDGQNTSTVIGRYWTALCIFRWQLTAYIFVFLRAYSHFQVMALLLISFAFQLMIAHGKPKESTLANISALFNEVMVSAYLYIMMCLMISQNLTNDTLGWALVAIIFLTVMVNFVKFAIQFLFFIWTFVKGRLRKIILKKSAK